MSKIFPSHQIEFIDPHISAMEEIPSAIENEDSNNPHVAGLYTLGSALIYSIDMWLTANDLPNESYFYSWTNSDLHQLTCRPFCNLPTLDPGFLKRNSSEINNFLIKNSYLIGTLNDLSVLLAASYAVSDIELELFTDDYEKIETLIVTPKFRTVDVDELIAIENDILDNFFFPIASSVSDRLTLSI